MEQWINEKPRSSIHQSNNPLIHFPLMETILLLAHTEADGSLAKSAREALRAARTLNKALAGSSLVVGLVGETVQAAADSIAACPATKYFGVAGKDFAPPRHRPE